MKFILVNHRTPLNTATCTECERSLGTGYLREVSSQRQYCDHAGRGGKGGGELVAATCWYSISFAKAAMRVGELMATESFGPLSDPADGARR